MKRYFLAAAFVALSASAAFAEDIMASRYGNTTVSTDPSGVVTKLYYKADGTFTGVQNGQNFSGTWKLDASNTLCLTFAQPVKGVTSPLCTPASAHQVGDSWGAAGFTVKLVQGIQ